MDCSIYRLRIEELKIEKEKEKLHIALNEYYKLISIFNNSVDTAKKNK